MGYSYGVSIKIVSIKIVSTELRYLHSCTDNKLMTKFPSNFWLLRLSRANIKHPRFHRQIFQTILEFCVESFFRSHHRFGEHLRYATNLDTPSNPEETMALHYRIEHTDFAPSISFNLLAVESNTVLRKVSEAHLIYTGTNPELNDKEECRILQRFLVRGIVNFEWLPI